MFWHYRTKKVYDSPSMTTDHPSITCFYSLTRKNTGAGTGPADHDHRYSRRSWADPAAAGPII